MTLSTFIAEQRSFFIFNDAISKEHLLVYLMRSNQSALYQNYLGTRPQNNTAPSMLLTPSAAPKNFIDGIQSQRQRLMQETDDPRQESSLAA